jgi:hypothetical protein
MKGQLNLFANLPPPSDKPKLFKPARRPIWTENKAKLIERYLYYFVLVTKHGAYIDGFAGPQYEGKEDAWAAKLGVIGAADDVAGRMRMLTRARSWVALVDRVDLATPLSLI